MKSKPPHILPMAERIELAREGYAWGVAHPGFDLADIQGWPADKWCAAIASEMERIPPSSTKPGWLDAEAQAKAVERFLVGGADFLGDVVIMNNRVPDEYPLDGPARLLIEALPWVVAGLNLAGAASGCEGGMLVHRFFSAIYAAEACPGRGMMARAFGGRKRPGELGHDQALALMEGFKLDASTELAGSAKPRSSL